MTETTHTVDLQQPIQRGDQLIASVSLRRPLAGELRGIKLVDLLQMDVDAICTLLPRITIPGLQTHELHQMDPADFSSLAIKVVGFFVTETAQPESLSA